MAQEKKLTDLFLDELFLSMISRQGILEACLFHLEYSYIPKELQAYKLIFKHIKETWELQKKAPTIGAISQFYENHRESEQIQATLLKIKAATMPNEEVILTRLEAYIRQTSFELIYEKVAEFYEKDDKDHAIEMMQTELKRISEISIREAASKFHRLFADFEEGIAEDRAEAENTENHFKVPFGIDPLDDIANGGMRAGETALWVLPSAGGKSTLLRYHGWAAASMGFDVFHIQAEGGLNACRRKYNQLWTRVPFADLEIGLIPEKSRKLIDKMIRTRKKQGNEIIIYSYEQFAQATVLNLRNRVIEYVKLKGKAPDLIIIDSLDLFLTGTNKKLDTDPDQLKYRLKEVARLVTNLAIEFKTRVIIATQSGHVAPEKLEDPKFVLTRGNTEGDRTLVQPFYYVFTFNRTKAETKAEEGRIFIDKIRNYAPKLDPIRIATSFKTGTFYSRTRTVKGSEKVTEKDV